MRYLQSIGEYFLMLKGVFGRMTKRSVLKELIFKEIDVVIIGSLGIVSFLSFFIGAVVALQTALNLNNPLIPKSLIAFAARQSIILEFAPTFISIIMAGKVGSFITSSIGSMRVTEQIDALEVMGINSLNYLVFPKIIAMLTYPFLIAISMFLGIMGAYTAAVMGGFVPADVFLQGLQEEFDPYHLFYAFFKTFLFAFILATVPSYHGYYMKGGSLEVGQASTTSFVWTSVVIIITNYIVTQLLLS
ncbi:ABC transporter permease [Salinimicrobium sp. MT39]|uniref:ABC transporter permease n=1 Tax=Salinimicrobium profundisediminis TaxID=2994553 RepID=A0A9X3CY04_9FLAO|nr:ABC transporter permease [Salinimicrobium profundisediminis]MCX2838891.1 ABC transporter permease [Salinimicrobium profundisediminis]